MCFNPPLPCYLLNWPVTASNIDLLTVTYGPIRDNDISTLYHSVAR